MRHLAAIFTVSILAVAPAQAQFPGVDLTGGIAAGLGAPISCESCENLVVTRTLGVQIRSMIGLTYRGVRFGDQSLASTDRMTTDLVSLEYYAPVPGRFRPYLSGGFGHSSVRIKNSWGGHYYDTYDGASLPTAYWGLGADIRLFKHLALGALVSSAKTVGGTSRVESCMQGNYLSGDFSYTCSGTPDSKYRYELGGFSIGLAIR